MNHSSPAKLILIACLWICCLTYNLALSDIPDVFGYAIVNCDRPENEKTKTYIDNINLLFSDFISNSSVKLYHNTSIGNTPDKVFGYYMCRGDVTPQDCRNCVNMTTQLARASDYKCQNFSIYASFDCVLGYTNQSMYGLWENRAITYVTTLGVSKYNYEQYKQTVVSTMEDVINEAASESVNDTKLPVLGFATKVVNLTGDEKLHTLAQCTPDILGVNCVDCLKNLLNTVPENPQSNYYDYQGVDAIEAKCLFRFYYQSLIDSKVEKPSKNDGVKLSNLVAIYSAISFYIYYAFLG